MSFSNTQQYHRFVITSLQYTAVAWIGPSEFRSDPLYTMSTGSTVAAGVGVVGAAAQDLISGAEQAVGGVAGGLRATAQDLV